MVPLHNAGLNELEKLALSSGEVERILCAGTGGLCITGPDLRCRFATPMLAQMLACDRDKLIGCALQEVFRDRKSTRLNSSHANISYAVFCLTRPPPRSTLFPYTTLFRSTQ